MSLTARRHDRIPAKAKVRLESGASGITRDMSPTGVYFVIDDWLEQGDTLPLTIDFSDSTDPAGMLQLACTVEVVRVEDVGGKRGVAVAILESRLERRSIRRDALTRINRIPGDTRKLEG